MTDRDMILLFSKGLRRFRILLQGIKYRFVAIILSFTTYIPQLVKRRWRISDLNVFAHPWYHNFRDLGINTPQNTIPNYKYNQAAKSEVIFKMIDTAIVTLRRQTKAPIAILEYFAADSYYGLYALKSAGSDSTLCAIDLGGGSGEAAKRNKVLDQGLLIARALKIEDRFEQLNQSVFDANRECNLLLNIGGLYHIENVHNLLIKSLNSGADFMILQSVVHEDLHLDSFFVSPAPEWTWGSRFSAKWIRDSVQESGWKILEEEFNILELNESKFDRGSIYFLCSRL